MKIRLLQTMTMTALLACASTASADVTPPDEQVCQGHAPGDPCITMAGNAGSCLMQTVQQGPPDSGLTRTAVVCTANSTADAAISDGLGSESTPARTSCGCAVPGQSRTGAMSIAMLALGLFVSRRRARR